MSAGDSAERRDFERREPVGDELVHAILAQIEEEELLSRLLGVPIGPPNPDPDHAPRIRPSLVDWLRRAEEVLAFLRARTQESDSGQ